MRLGESILICVLLRMTYICRAVCEKSCQNSATQKTVKSESVMAGQPVRFFS
jgi:hypothetical protein